MRWRHEDDVRLIESIKEHPCLWNTKSEDNHNRNKRTKAVHTVMESLRKSGIIVSEAKAMNRFRNLRTVYIRQKRKVEIGNAGGEMYVSHWQLYPFFEFLNDCLTPAVCISNGPINHVEAILGDEPPESPHMVISDVRNIAVMKFETDSVQLGRQEEEIIDPNCGVSFQLLYFPTVSFQPVHYNSVNIAQDLAHNSTLATSALAQLHNSRIILTPTHQLHSSTLIQPKTSPFIPYNLKQSNPYIIINTTKCEDQVTPASLPSSSPTPGNSKVIEAPKRKKKAPSNGRATELFDMLKQRLVATPNRAAEEEEEDDEEDPSVFSTCAIMSGLTSRLLQLPPAKRHKIETALMTMINEAFETG